MRKLLDILATASLCSAAISASRVFDHLFDRPQRSFTASLIGFALALLGTLILLHLRDKQPAEPTDG